MLYRRLLQNDKFDDTDNLRWTALIVSPSLICSAALTFPIELNQIQDEHQALLAEFREGCLLPGSLGTGTCDEYKLHKVGGLIYAIGTDIPIRDPGLARALNRTRLNYVLIWRVLDPRFFDHQQILPLKDHAHVTVKACLGHDRNHTLSPFALNTLWIPTPTQNLQESAKVISRLLKDHRVVGSRISLTHPVWKLAVNDVCCQSSDQAVIVTVLDTDDFTPVQLSALPKFLSDNLNEYGITTGVRSIIIATGQVLPQAIKALFDIPLRSTSPIFGPGLTRLEARELTRHAQNSHDPSFELGPALKRFLYRRLSPMMTSNLLLHPDHLIIFHPSPYSFCAVTVDERVLNSSYIPPLDGHVEIPAIDENQAHDGEHSLNLRPTSSFRVTGPNGDMQGGEFVQMCKKRHNGVICLSGVGKTSLLEAIAEGVNVVWFEYSKYLNAEFGSLQKYVHKCFDVVGKPVIIDDFDLIFPTNCDMETERFLLDGRITTLHYLESCSADRPIFISATQTDCFPTRLLEKIEFYSGNNLVKE